MKESLHYSGRLRPTDEWDGAPADEDALKDTPDNPKYDEGDWSDRDKNTGLLKAEREPGRVNSTLSFAALRSALRGNMEAHLPESEQNSQLNTSTGNDPALRDPIIHRRRRI